MKSIVLLFAFVLAQNCQHKTDIENSPFAIEYVYFQKWTGGQEQTGSGTNFVLKLKERLPENCQLQKVYFLGQEASLQSDKYTIFVANFYKKPKKDYVMYGDSKKEYGNTVPEIRKPKFELEPNEAIIEYTKDDKLHYFKLKNCIQKEAIVYPSANPKN